MSDEPPEPGLDSMKLAAARLWATNHYPYLASAVFAAPTLPAPGVGRLVVDRWWRIHADPEVVASSSVAELGGELLHLTSHLLRDHATRADDLHFAEPAELHHWVDAADAEIADDFPADLERVEATVRPADLVSREGRLAEEYYRGGQVREHEENDCGSGAHGHAAEWEPPPPQDRESSDSDERNDGVGRDRQQLIRRNVAAEIERADQAAVPPGLRAWAAEQRQPSIDWRAELAAVIRRSVATAAGSVDYSYRRPSRRAAATPGVVLPSLVEPSVEVAVVCDTSASVSDELLGVAVAQVDGLLRAVGTRSVRVLSCDDAVHTVTRATDGRDVVLIGGGGTDMAVGIDAAIDQRPPPQLIVVLTDGYTPWPSDAPRADVVVGLLDDGSMAALGLGPPIEPPAWARTVTVTGGPVPVG